MAIGFMNGSVDVSLLDFVQEVPQFCDICSVQLKTKETICGIQVLRNRGHVVVLQENGMMTIVSYSSGDVLFGKLSHPEESLK